MPKKSKRTRRKLMSMPADVRSKIETMPESFRKPTVLGALIDIVYSRIRYGAGIDDYFDFRFYSLNHRGRKSFGTVRDKFAIRNYVNEPDYCVRISDKGQFAKYYGEFMRRNTFHVEAGTDDKDLQEYCARMKENGINRFFIKPCKGGEGIGVFILDVDDPILESVGALMKKYGQINAQEIKNRPHYEKKLLARDELMIEPMLENHPEVNKIHPSSLNTMRIPTLYTGGEFKIMAACIRFGRDGSVVDNINSGGMTAEIDLDTGVIMTPAVDHAGRQYVVHPTTNEIIVGLRIPFWDEIKEMVVKAAEVTPQVKYVGWDVAVTPNGPMIIEGNTCGSLQIQQIPRHLGNRYLYEEVLKKAGKW